MADLAFSPLTMYIYCQERSNSLYSHYIDTSRGDLLEIDKISFKKTCVSLSVSSQEYSLQVATSKGLGRFPLYVLDIQKRGPQRYLRTLTSITYLEVTK